MHIEKRRSLLAFVLLCFHKIEVTKGGSEADQHRHNYYKQVCAVANVLFKHDSIRFTAQIYLFHDDLKMKFL